MPHFYYSCIFRIFVNHCHVIMEKYLNRIFTSGSTVENILLMTDCLAIIILGYSQLSLKVIETISFALLTISIYFSVRTSGLSLKKILNIDEKAQKWRIIFELYIYAALFIVPDDNVTVRHMVADLTIALLFGIIIFAYIYFSRQRLEQNESIQSLTQEINSIIEKQQTEDRIIINNIFRRQFSAIDRLAAVRYEATDEKTLTKNYAREAARMVKELEPNSAEMVQLKQYIDSTRNNLITRFEKAFPHLSSYYYTLFLYTAIGLSPRAMSVLFNIPVETIYNRKSRLKNIIINAETPERNNFFEAIS